MEKKYTLVEQVRRDFRFTVDDLPAEMRLYVKKITLPVLRLDTESRRIVAEGFVVFELSLDSSLRGLAEQKVGELDAAMGQIFKSFLEKLSAFVGERKTKADALKGITLDLAPRYVQSFCTRLAEPIEHRDGYGGVTVVQKDYYGFTRDKATVTSFMDHDDDERYEEREFSFHNREEYASVLDTVAAWQKSGLTLHDFHMQTDPAYREKWMKGWDAFANRQKKASPRTDKSDTANAAPVRDEKPAPAPAVTPVPAAPVTPAVHTASAAIPAASLPLSQGGTVYTPSAGDKVKGVLGKLLIAAVIIAVLALAVFGIVRLVGVIGDAWANRPRKSVLVIEEGTTVIEAGAYAKNEKIERVEIPASVTTIGEGAFRNCDKLKVIVFAEGSQLQTIGKEAFYECDVLSAITLPEGVVSIGEAAFSWTAITALHIPASVTSIGANLVDSASGVTSLTVAEGNTVYDSRGGCNAIIETATNTLILGCNTTVIPDGTAAIAPQAFYRCHFTEITLPASIQVLREDSFRVCPALTTVTLTGVREIELGAFYLCDALQSVVVFDCLERLSAEFALECDSFEGNIDGGVRYIGNTQNPYLAAFCNMGYMTGLHADTRVIADCAFMNGWIPTLPEGLRVIGEGAFASSDNTATLRIPASVTYIGDSAFKGGKALTTITVAEGNTVYDSREDCNAIIETATGRMIVGCKTSTVPDGVTAIATGTLYFPERARAVVLPASVTVLEEAVGTWSIGKVYYCGTAADWSAVAVGAGNKDVTDDLYFYSEQAPAADGKYWHYDASNQPVAWE